MPRTCTWCGCSVDLPDQWWWEVDYCDGKHDEVCQRCGDGGGLLQIAGEYPESEKNIKHPHLERLK